MLFIDDFAISTTSEEEIKILFYLIKKCGNLGSSSCSAVSIFLINGKVAKLRGRCYGILVGIRRRLTTGYMVLIEQNNK